MKESKIPIAVVEDNYTTRDALKTIIDLDPEFECVGTCATGEEALKLLPKVSPEIVLMDIQLPGMSGIDCVRRLREALPDVLIVMVTVYEDPVRIFSALRAGANGYLLKRSTPEEILSAIREVRRGGGAMSGGVAMKVIQYFSGQEKQSQELDSLSRRESEVLELLSCGLGNKEIADRLGVSTEAVRWHLRSIYTKLHVHNRTEAAMKFRGNL
ncbi:response regulator transcription factor [Luteolibacter sp. GHJ8]|jgi:DNA-binding NarL/FixJ family response regulator|uniref:Response regulator transcription factor n=1 Tax=Luteolibacter rhizosphaerae TaxID=2989719 RepID=A0ABT3G2L3_9BACT|nr:response regulator transcription factor [Luteolibacter rhizosphaerae]MCW1913756.1 response regulator transcription factor [Luteolibacter rhizosphaerae]